MARDLGAVPGEGVGVVLGDFPHDAGCLFVGRADEDCELGPDEVLEVLPEELLQGFDAASEAGIRGEEEAAEDDGRSALVVGLQPHLHEVQPGGEGVLHGGLSTDKTSQFHLLVFGRPRPQEGSNCSLVPREFHGAHVKPYEKAARPFNYELCCKSSRRGTRARCSRFRLAQTEHQELQLQGPQ